MSFHKATFIKALVDLLGPYKRVCDETITALWHGSTELDHACLYALQTGGKRFRPAIVWMMQDALGDTSWRQHPEAGLACEYFHTSSLIADDSPCMDNDDYRRGQLTTHKKFSESTALLASFALISEGFRAIAQMPLRETQDASTLSFAIFEASRTMGIDGLLGGQMLDLKPQDMSEEQLWKMVDQKTGALFELCFILGWIFGGGRKELSGQVQSLAISFGRAFQLIDDLDDYEQDLAMGKVNNYAVLHGLEVAADKAKAYVYSFQEGLKTLGLSQSPLASLSDILLQALV